MGKLSRKTKIAITILIIAGAGYYFSQSKATNNINYLTEKVVYGDLNKTVIATGTVRSSNRVQVGAQISGQLEKINVALGQKVKKGDLIAQIDSTTQENSLATAEAKLSSFQSQLKAAKTNYEIALSSYNRNRKLYRVKATSLDTLNSSKQTLANARSNVAEFESQITQAQISVKTAITNLGYTKIIAPMDGTVISIPVSTGQTVNANQVTPTIVQIANLKTMLIKAEISEGDITHIKPGMKVTFTTLSDPNTKHVAAISSIDPALTTLTDNQYSESVSDTNPIYYYANINVPNKDNKLLIGMTTTDIISVNSQKNVLLVPTTAIQKEGENNIVRILTADKKVENRVVTLGESDDVNTVIKSGLKVGENIIVAGATSNAKSKMPSGRGMGRI